MDYGGLPPEVNSARMYTGPGSMSMTAAASAWSALAAELDSAAAGYETLVNQLAGEGWL
ncbi:PPE domain-containing protein, partial [Mycobacterium kansasii]